MEFEENELIQMVNDNDEDIKDVLFEKYSYIVEIILSKYRRTIYGLKVDYSEIKQEAYLAFTNALVTYNEEKETSLSTFISTVVERKVYTYIKRKTTKKHEFEKSTLSLELETEDAKDLLARIGDITHEPSNMIIKDEDYQNLQNRINSALSPFEKDVYNLLINNFSYFEIAQILKKDIKSIDNCIQRLRKKIKEILDTNKIM